MRTSSTLAPEAGAFPAAPTRPVAPGPVLRVEVVRPRPSGSEERFAGAQADGARTGRAPAVATAAPSRRLAQSAAPAYEGRASLTQIVSVLIQALVDWLRVGLPRLARAKSGQWRSRREARVSAALARDLDARILRDIGITDAQALAVNAERHNLAEATRLRVLLDPYLAGR